jgi:hypothetical protein
VSVPVMATLGSALAMLALLVVVGVFVFIRRRKVSFFFKKVCTPNLLVTIFLFYSCRPELDYCVLLHHRDLTFRPGGQLVLLVPVMNHLDLVVTLGLLHLLYQYQLLPWLLLDIIKVSKKKIWFLNQLINFLVTCSSSFSVSSGSSCDSGSACASHASRAFGGYSSSPDCSSYGPCLRGQGG